MATTKRTCSVPECPNQVHCRELCSKHYQRLMDTGSTDPRPRPTVAQRLMAKVNKTAYCWEWTGAKNKAGYPNFYLGGRYVNGHRVSYEIHHGPIPEGMEVDHECHNEGCVNPAHLRLATPKHNVEYQSGPHSRSTSGVRGVSWDKDRQKWHASVGHHGKTVHVGRFLTLEEADAAVRAKRAELYAFPEAV